MYLKPDPKLTDLENAARLAPWACAAYADDHAVGGSEVKGSFSAYNAQGFYRETSLGTIVVIAGTNDAGDWADNVDHEPYELERFGRDHFVDICRANKGVELHTGFLQHAAAVCNVLRDEIPDLDDHRQVWLVGHSLGGAVASILPLLWPGLRARIVTYGAPRIVYRNSFSICPRTYVEHLRLVDIDDLVPQVPFMYRHPPSNLRIIRKPGQVREELSLQDRLWRLARRAVNFWRPISSSRQAHDCRRYTYRLEGLV